MSESNSDHLCKICSSETVFIFNKRVLSKYNIAYFQCNHCHFLQTEEPVWLDEAYSTAITQTDIGMIHRNLYLAGFTSELLNKNFDWNSDFLDFGGGYGLFVRLMRDKGYKFIRQDSYCENIFSQYFDVTEESQNKIFYELITSFEVFEHLPNPLSIFEELINKSNALLISTELQPLDYRSLENWEYLMPIWGQHISLFHIKTLEYLAKKFDLYLYSDLNGLHLFSKKELKRNPFKPSNILERIYFRLFNTKEKPQSLLFVDHEFVMAKSSIKE